MIQDENIKIWTDITIKKTASITLKTKQTNKNTLTKKSSGQDCFPGEYLRKN